MSALYTPGMENVEREERMKTPDNGPYPLMPQMAPDGHLPGTVLARR
jgi:hypothetical protein